MTEWPWFYAKIAYSTFMNASHLNRITVDPDVMVGKPVIRGTRIPVERIVRLVAQGLSDSEILSDYPGINREDIKAALSYAADVIAHEDIYNLPSSALG